MVALLLSAGAHTDLENENGETAFDKAREFGRQKVEGYKTTSDIARLYISKYSGDVGTVLGNQRKPLTEKQGQLFPQVHE